VLDTENVKLLSSSAFKFNLRRYTLVAGAAVMCQSTFKFGNRNVGKLMAGQCRFTLSNSR